MTLVVDGEDGIGVLKIDTVGGDEELLEGPQGEYLEGDIVHLALLPQIVPVVEEAVAGLDQFIDLTLELSGAELVVIVIFMVVVGDQLLVKREAALERGAHDGLGCPEKRTFTPVLAGYPEHAAQGEYERGNLEQEERGCQSGTYNKERERKRCAGGMLRWNRLLKQSRQAGD